MTCMKFVQGATAALLSFGLSLGMAEAAQARGPLSVPVPGVSLQLDTTFVSPASEVPLRLAQAVPESAPGLSQTSPLPELEAQALLKLGLIQLVEGSTASAQTVFEKVIQLYPGTSAAGTAAIRLLELKAAQAEPGRVGTGGSGAGGIGAAPPQAGKTNGGKANGGKTNGGKAEFIVTETLLGGYAGFWMMDAFGVGGENAAVLLPMGGLGAGLGASLLISGQREISSAEAMQLRSIQALSTLNAAGWAVALTRDQLDTQSFAGMQLLGLGLGTGLGALSLKPLSLTEGQVAFVTSLGVWAPLFALAGNEGFTPDVLSYDQERFILPVAADIGVAAGFLLVHDGRIKLSRGRMMLINLGGGLGMALAGALMIAADTMDGQIEFQGLVLGGLGGLVAGVLATRHWDATYNPEVLARSERPTVLTVEDGRLKLGRILPQVRPEARITRAEDQWQRTTGVSVQLGLLGGAF